MNITSNTTTEFPVRWIGGRGRFSVSGTFDGATAQLSVKNDTSAVYIPVNSQTAITSAGNGYFTLEAGATIAVVTTGGGGSLSISANIQLLSDENSTEERVSVLEDSVSTLEAAPSPPIEFASTKLKVGDLGGDTLGLYAINIQTNRSYDNNVASGIAAIAIGQETKATGSSSVALGSGTKAALANSLAIGSSCYGSGSYSTAIGSTAVASGNNSLAIGVSSAASNTRSTAIGTGTLSSGVSSISIGSTDGGGPYQPIASGKNSISIGGGEYYYNQGTKATAANTVALGISAEASATDAMAMGNNATASGVSSIAIGVSSTSGGAYSLAIGSSAKTTISQTMEIGRWTTPTARNVAIRMASSKVAFSIPNTATAPTDGGATAGSEAAGTLPREMITFRRNGNAILADINVAGTVRTLSLGTAT